jgi:hypothetical protein
MTYATLLLSRGHHPKLVQELLGHASVAMTLDRYSHVLPGMGTKLPPPWKPRSLRACLAKVRVKISGRMFSQWIARDTSRRN